jgi:hypothetical protein
MTNADFEPTPRSRHLTAILRRVSGPIKVARNGAVSLVARLPGTVAATQVGARATTTALQKLSDSTLRSMAATSAGVGAGLYLAGKRRFAVVAGIVPAFIGAAIVMRPSKSPAPAKTAP